MLSTSRTHNPPVPGYFYQLTEDFNTKKCFHRPTKTFLGWVRKIPTGWAYRTSEVEPWCFGPKLKIEAAECLEAAHGTIE